MKSKPVTSAQPKQIVPQDVGGLGHDVRVPLAADRYDAVTIARMVKLVNRRGRVRWFDYGEWKTLEGQAERQWVFYKPPAEKIARLDEHAEFINEALSNHRELGLYVSFEDRFEALRFASDMAVLNATVASTPKPTKQEIAEQAKREALAHKHSQLVYPRGPVLRVSKHEVAEIGIWCVMVAAGGRSPADVNRWMRTNLVGRYWAATWVPDQPPRYQQASYRYYRLGVATWKALIDRSREEGSKLIIAIQLHEDRDRFDECLGPKSFLKR